MATLYNQPTDYSSPRNPYAQKPIQQTAPLVQQGTEGGGVVGQKVTYDNQGLGQKVATPVVVGNQTQQQEAKTTQQPVRVNAFTVKPVGGRGKTVEQRAAIMNQNNDAYLQAAASDRLAQHDYDTQMARYQQDVQAYQRGDLPTAPTAPTKPVENANLNAFAQKEKALDRPDNTTAAPEDNSFQAFRNKLYDEEKIRKKSDTQAKIMAVGDVLRNIGNLYYTAHDASPQTFSTSPATEERERYEKGREARDAAAYKYYQADLKQKADEAERKRQDALAQDKMQTNASTRERNKAATAELYQKIGINAEKAPYELQKLVGEAVKAQEEGNKAKYETAIKQIEAEWLPKEKEATVKLKEAEASAATTNAAANMMRAKSATAVAGWNIKKIKAEIGNIGKGKSFEIPSGKDPSKNYVIDKENSTVCGNALRGIARKKAAQWGLDKEHLDGTSLLSAAYEHIDDPDIENVLIQYSHGKTTSNGTVNPAYVLGGKKK